MTDPSQRADALPPAPLWARICWPVWLAGGKRDRLWSVYRVLVSKPLEWLYSGRFAKRYPPRPSLDDLLASLERKDAAGEVDGRG